MVNTTDSAAKLPKATASKIENDTEKPAGRPMYRVEVSFDSLDKGDVFAQDPGDTAWAEQHVETGYLKRLDGEEPGVERSDVGQGGPVPS